MPKCSSLMFDGCFLLFVLRVPHDPHYGLFFVHPKQNAEQTFTILFRRSLALLNKNNATKPHVCSAMPFAA